jgi:hypothetical protein
MLSDNTFSASSISNKGWMKVIEHDGTMNLGENPIHHNYNNISYCPFCGSKIEKIS